MTNDDDEFGYILRRRGLTTMRAPARRPDVTLARPVALRRVRKPASLPRKDKGANPPACRPCDSPFPVELREELAADLNPLLHDPGARVRQRARERRAHSALVSSHPSATPLPPYSSFGLITNRSRVRAQVAPRDPRRAVPRDAVATRRSRARAANDRALVGGEKVSVALVGQHREERLLVRNLAAERVGDADGAGR